MGKMKSWRLMDSKGDGGAARAAVVAENSLEHDDFDESRMPRA